jgi:hypothetical protein
MTGYETYKIFLAINKWFNEGYDFLKYSEKGMKSSSSSFEKRKDKSFYYKIGGMFDNRDDLILFFVANFLVNTGVWADSLVDADVGIDNYKIIKKNLDSLSYIFETDCDEIFSEVSNPNELLRTVGDHPILLKKMMTGKVYIETVCILNKILTFIPKWDILIKDDIIWPSYKKKIEIYSEFLPSDIGKYQDILSKILIREFSDNEKDWNVS